MWHLLVNGDTNSPYVFEDKSVLHQYITTLPTGSIFIIRDFDVRLIKETVYGVTGSPPIPQKPTTTIPIVAQSRTHFVKV